MAKASTSIKWSTEIYAPFPYQIELVSGECFWFYDAKGQDGLGFYGHAGAGWKIGGVDVGLSPSNNVEIPLGVNLTWLSHTERKYYHIKYHLPRQAIAEAFAEKFDFEMDQKRNTRFYKSMDFAFAPGGFVSLRVSGVKTKEIANFQAEEANISWEFFARTNNFNPEGLTEEKYNSGFINDMPEPYKQQALKGEFPKERWKNYSNNKYPWHIATKMDLYGYRQSCVNGDSFFITKNNFKDIDLKQLQAVPTWYKWFYKENGKRYFASISFSKNIAGRKEDPEGDLHIFETFQKYFSSHQQSTALVIDKIDGQFVAYLTNGTKKVELTLHHLTNRELREEEFIWF